ncbi:MAG: aminoacyl-tRNA hydrolase [Spirochaetaceae bacterium]|jgi:ribosome-associated protein|nr:aminoacyl-tRNA hydrolase [Spirochaetaceae bacterium]
MNKTALYNSIRQNAEVSYSKSGGPGGQNVNKLNTKVTLRIRLKNIAGLTAAEISCLRKKLSNRLSDNGEELIVQSDEERFQRINEEQAFIRLEALIISAAHVPKSRRPTKPSRAAKEKRLAEKKLQGQKKADRSKLSN